MAPRGGSQVTVSVSPFAPKAHTPFQWAAMDPPEEIERKRKEAKKKRKPRIKKTLVGMGIPTVGENEDLAAALDELAPGRYHVAIGLKHADPKIEATVDDLAEQGFGHLIGMVLAPHDSAYSIG